MRLEYIGIIILYVILLLVSLYSLSMWARTSNKLIETEHQLQLARLYNSLLKGIKTDLESQRSRPHDPTNPLYPWETSTSHLTNQTRKGN